jgi:hypothetical protein
MALTGKTIGELSYLQFPTNDTLIPVEYIGDTYHITFSSITYNVGTYSQFVVEANNGLLTPGRFYLMSDYQTCYDQPNYDSQNNPILTGNYKTGTTEPLLLMATSTTGFSPTVYSELYPTDIISYDINWGTTEVTNSPAKGIITYRKDNQGNAFDYDFRGVVFKRYDAYFSERLYNGIVSIDSQGVVTGTTTSFTNFTVGDIVGILNNNIGLQDDLITYFEIVSISGDTNMVVTGETIYTQSNVRLVDANILVGMSWKQNNIISNTNSYEYPTFEYYNGAFNNISINNLTQNQFEEDTFLLPNNVFRSTDEETPSNYIDNLFGSTFRNNTFNDDCDANIVRDDFYNNIITNDFDHNTINDTFRDNIIDCDFSHNIINGTFYSNHFGDIDGHDFDYNIIDGSFYENFFTGEDNFEYNIIKGSFYNNIILDEFSKNTLNGFYDNISYDSFRDNQIGEGFYGNVANLEFAENIIGEEVYDNNFFGRFVQNLLTGHNFYNNDLYDTFEDNQIGSNFYENSIYFIFSKNKILTNFNTNTIGTSAETENYFESNNIMSNFKGNDIQGDFTDNNIKTNFIGNDILVNFSYNNVGFEFLANIFSGATLHNNIGDYFEFNNCEGVFMYNTIGTSFSSNDIKDGFGFGYGSYQGNRIGNNFYNNNIGEYFYNNTIPDNFLNNNIGDYFQWNIVDTNVDNIDFTTNYGNITGFTYISLGTGATDNSYGNVGGVTDGSGVNALFQIDVVSGSAVNVSISNTGELYNTGNTVTILGTSIGGVTGVITTFLNDGIGLTGATGSYDNIFAQGTGGENASFNVTVVDGFVDSVVLNQGGIGYSIGEMLTIDGDVFGSTENINLTVESVYSDDVIITVSGVSQPPSVYELYTCNIFKNSNLTNRLSYYDANDVLTIKNINE